MKLRDINDLFFKILGGFSATVAVLVVASDPDKIEKISESITGNGLSIKFLMVLLIFLVVMASFSVFKWYLTSKIREYDKKIEGYKNENNILADELENEKGSHRKAILELKNTKRHIYEIKKQQEIDLITGIPNERMLKEDLKKAIDDIETGQQFYMIFIDIDNFKSVNDEYSHYKGDELVTMIAQDLYQGMRRNELVYKKTFIEDEDVPLTNSVYRKYSGGDEFIILVEGEQYEAVGFLNRIFSGLSKLNLKIRERLKINFDLKFKAVIFQLSSIDGYSDGFYQNIWENIIPQGLRKIKQEEYPYRAVWFKEEEAYDFAKKIYAIARENFKKTKA